MFLNNKYCLKLNEENGKIELYNFRAGVDENKEFAVSLTNYLKFKNRAKINPETVNKNDDKQ